YLFCLIIWTSSSLLELLSFPTRRSSDLIINAGDSIVIRAMISEQLLALDLISSLDLRDEAYHLHEGVTQTDLISYDELLSLVDADRKSTRLNSSHVKISYAVFCLKKKKA